MRQFTPIGRAVLRWRTPAEGGRPTGRPSGAQYAPSAIFLLGGEAEVIPGWPDNAERFSIGLNLNPPPQPEWEPVDFDFFARDLVMDKLRPDVQLLITEGWTVVADLRVTELLVSE